MLELGDIINIDCKKCEKKTSHIYSFYAIFSPQLGYVWKCVLCKNEIRVDKY